MHCAASLAFHLTLTDPQSSVPAVTWAACSVPPCEGEGTVRPLFGSAADRPGPRRPPPSGSEVLMALPLRQCGIWQQTRVGSSVASDFQRWHVLCYCCYILSYVTSYSFVWFYVAFWNLSSPSLLVDLEENGFLIFTDYALLVENSHQIVNFSRLYQKCRMTFEIFMYG